MRTKTDNELYNIFSTDGLVCLGCGYVIWRADPEYPKFYFSDIDYAYRQHLYKCYALKRLVVAQKNISHDARK